MTSRPITAWAPSRTTRRSSTIWEGMRRYFHEEAQLPVEVVLFQSYEAQVAALLARRATAPRIDIAWNTNLAYLQARRLEQAGGAGRWPCATPISEWTTKIVARTGGAVPAAVAISAAARSPSAAATAATRRSCRSTSSPQEGLVEGRDYQSLRFDTDVGKHGDTGTSEVEVAAGGARRARRRRRGRQPLLEERRARAQLVPAGALTVDLDLAALLTTACSRRAPGLDGAGAALRRGALRHELRQPDSSRRPRGRGAQALGAAATPTATARCARPASARDSSHARR